ncbi:hypothetical protein [Scleromatobacter humisilvae]|uniref:Pilin accessory protein (PilO) n=1 Tax=Scleromatobacter humisilvae TaxID=2897159 RepID=A0A9X1YJB9_9BURK|nr:hypothetical protein [Scleromatobacter humisilvae]MCK9686981.1 hypothetical protein [Scleromatobacter humisilvae]
MAMIERMIASTAQGDLLGGLFWRAPTAGQSRGRALVEARALTSDATHWAQAQVGSHVRYGLFQPRASEEGVRLPKGTLAAAACFSRLVGQRAPNAALVLAVPASAQRKEDKYFVVCLEDGVPVIDVLSNEIDARNALGGEDRPIWSDNPVAYPNCEPADFAWLVSGGDRLARLQPMPINPWPIVGTGLAAAASLGAWVLVQHLHRVEAERKAVAAARAADPTPRYLAALAGQQASMATDRSTLVAATREIFGYRTWIPGWSLASAECSARAQACTRDWVRRGGSFEDLRRALPDETLEMLVPQGSSVPALDVARTRRLFTVARHTMLDPHRPLRSLQVTFSDAGPQLQRWRTADVVVDLKRPSLWPRVPEVPASFQHPAAVLAGDVDMHNVPGPFIVEALSSAPDFVSWESVRVDLGEGSDARGLLKFSASGVFYVAAR